MSAPRSPSGRLVDIWHGGTDRDPADVVAEHRHRAPAWLRKQIRPLTAAEGKLWQHLGNRAWMGTDVFTQVPLYIPDIRRGWVVAFLVPARAIAIEIVPGRFRDSVGSLSRHVQQDDLVREMLGIATLRWYESHVLEDAHAAARSIRWDLGYDDGDPAPGALNLPLS